MKRGPSPGLAPNVSLIGALIVPSVRLDSLQKEYLHIRKSLPCDARGEVKGRLLNESQVASLVPLLYHHGVIFQATAIELGTHDEKRLRLVQQVRGHNITSKLTAEHSEEARQKLYRYRAVFEGLKLPLMVQSILTFDFIPRIIELATMYFSQRRPEELSAFHWVINAKGDSLEPTEWEAWWSDFIMPAMQSRSFERPMHSLPVGDYSHMK
jgi:hypothetical protein